MKNNLKLVLVSVLTPFFILFPGKVFASQLEVPSQYSTIQSAIDIAQTGDVVNVAAGTYNEVINFEGKDIVVQGNGAAFTTIDGTGINSSVVSAVTGESNLAKLQGFTVIGGSGTIISSGNPRCGGGVYVRDSSITLQDLIINNNIAQEGRAVCFISSPNSLVDNIEISNYEDETNAGNSIIQIEGSQWGQSGFVTFTNSRFMNNNGGMSVAGAGATLNDVLIENNNNFNVTVIGNSGIGGDLNPPLTFNNTIVRDNYDFSFTDWQGGWLVINNSEFSNNHQTGGSIIYYGNDSILEISNTTIVGNTSEVLSDETVVQIRNYRDWGGWINISNSIVWGNTGFSNSPITLPEFGGGSYTLANINYSLIQGGWPDTNSVGILDIDPLFVDLLNGDYHLTSSSPSIDSGDPNSPLDPDGTRADMGVYPFFQVPSPTEQIESLVDLVISYNFQNGILNSLDQKLETAQSALGDVNENNDQAAINSLQAFINAVEAQSGNKITNEQADALVQKAQVIINQLSS
ncbi:MAG TPA: hypothetical protein VI819_02445 [Patescibacteria group bacterium]|nr:hypothetical protein [Patescibacteria group bacterium]